MEKICTKCGKEKDILEFPRDRNASTGFSSICKQCKREYASNRWKTDKDYRDKRKAYNATPKRREYCRQYADKRRNDPDKKKYIKEYGNEYRNKNREKLNNYVRDRVSVEPEYRDVINARAKGYREKNREHVLEIGRKSTKKRRGTDEYKQWRNNYEQNKRDTDVGYKLLISLRNRIHNVISKKSNSSKDLLGCNIEFLIKHLEKQFYENMNWDNYGFYWHVDHIIPCAYFNFENEIDQRICFNYRNLQPLTVSENCSKQDSLPENYLAIKEKIMQAIEKPA